MSELKIEYASKYFVGEKFFEDRRGAEDYVKTEEIIDYLIHKNVTVSQCRDIAKALVERYTMEERYDYKKDKQEEA